jgi:23S rRNA (guanosine2251-2'-O)-methyltransferase
MKKLNSKELRTIEDHQIDLSHIKRNPITIILDNVLDTYNVGAIFRLADAIAVNEVILCGQTLIPPNPKIKKSSIETWKWVPWRYEKTTLSAIANLKEKNAKLKVISVEQDRRSKPFQKVKYTFPCAIVVGHETYGVSKDVLNASDMIVEIPMWGVNKSLNVMVSLGIVLFEVMKKK